MNENEFLSLRLGDRIQRSSASGKAVYVVTADYGAEKIITHSTLLVDGSKYVRLKGYRARERDQFSGRTKRDIMPRSKPSA